jgi:hypothetical protein
LDIWSVARASQWTLLLTSTVGEKPIATFIGGGGGENDHISMAG